MLDTCKMWAGRKKAMELQRTTDKYVDRSMVPREHEPHPELEGVISRPTRQMHKHDSHSSNVQISKIVKPWKTCREDRFRE